MTVGATSPGKATFRAQAFRSISGRVLVYDTKVSKYVPVNGIPVKLRERSLTTVTDPLGRYLFRDLAEGTYTLLVQDQAHTVRLRDQPVDLANVDFQTGIVDREPPMPEAPAVKPPAPIQAAPEQSVVTIDTFDRRAAAEQHNIIGRQLTKAGQYRQAIAELTEAIRLVPHFALALNARAFALILLREFTGALKDLNEAILLNPAYGNAYQLRSIARKATGDGPGAAADLKRSQQLALRK